MSDASFLSPGGEAPLDARWITEEAKRVSRRVGLIHPALLPIEIVALRCGLCVHDRPLKGAQAMLLGTREVGHAFVADHLPFRAWRFAVAHELAHFILHRATSRLPLCLGEDAAVSYAGSFVEREADLFARQLLMPRALVRAMFSCDEPSFSTAEALSEALSVSLTAAALRLAEVTARPMAVVRSRGNVVEWASQNYRFRRIANVKRGDIVDWNSAAFDATSGRVTPPRPVWLSTWSPSTPTRVEAVEDVRGIPGGALTLVWVP